MSDPSPGAALGEQPPAGTPDGESAPTAAKTPWLVFLVISVGALSTAILTVIGVTSLPRWGIFIVAFDLSATAAAITLALTEPKHRTTALWTSNALLLLLLGGIAVYSIAATTETINVVANSNVNLSNEAGASATHAPSNLSFVRGDAETVDCFVTVGKVVWLYFYQDSRDFGWAPQRDFHYETGFPEHLPPHCE